MKQHYNDNRDSDVIFKTPNQRDIINDKNLRFWAEAVKIRKTEWTLSCARFRLFNLNDDDDDEG